jgi:hypothetical protein
LPAPQVGKDEFDSLIYSLEQPVRMRAYYRTRCKTLFPSHHNKETRDANPQAWK